MSQPTMTHFGFSEVPFAEKVVKVKEVFDSVAGNYDLMNDLMSLGIHRLWKQFAIRRLRVRPGQHFLDVAGGTGDLARLLHEQLAGTGRVVIYDINANMLERGRQRLVDEGRIQGLYWTQGNAEELPFPDNSFHGVTIGFGIRNVTQMEAAFREMVRVLRPGGQLLCLEFSRLAIPFLEPLYDAYSFKILPELGHWIAKDRDAYQYLAESIRRFPAQEEVAKLLTECGLYGVRYHNLSAGIAAVHVGRKV
ncbi:bifunctional demethylmenaquinone methyltransferase/2-methoxy-6-polyprenyl-1,4-benzoquinol methylase UbiE [Candidatus Magnetaquicoccus inordinatus]|uniref:bifunctional demethylmenaquinone methyltransferase/2-methoxy-6-polyprenyl-1,4-benzoquinol methylase UbiE n=1 Tax=Candidatus Magnetaquicoccus inordinatus TaxID=2496818 RepID=UPI00102C75AB|nr:bifunctional demethylmenaquinone methyltransferase/2-methoxy-6-polyprenyl-1,4-benzoquinol methylase UbiE [Candidatus Magnetaquicoccus inordinatus]